MEVQGHKEREMSVLPSARKEYPWGVSFRIESALADEGEWRRVVSFLLYQGEYVTLPMGRINSKVYEPDE